MSETQATGTCGFCARQSDRVVEGPSGQYACWECLLKAREVIACLQKSFTCSFCLEEVPGVAVVEGPNSLHMCSACVESGIKLLAR
jgi:hypothetical protein